MKVINKANDIVITGLKDFDLGQTMECGQCFHFVKVGKNEYGIVAYGKFLHAKQTEDEFILYDTSEDEFENLWRVYFDLDRDYGNIKNTLLAKDEKLKEAVETMSGVRILNQEFFETLISFIISQNKKIPHIKQIVASISRQYGTMLGKIGDEEFYSFPDAAAMMEVSEEALRECKTGFRAPYIRNAVELVNAGAVAESILKAEEVDICRQQLMTIKGVGAKVANCTMLFGLGRREAFPVDVWIKRIMEYLYFEGKDTPKEQIEAFAVEQYGEYGGYAQQYLFYYGKSVQIGAASKRGAKKAKAGLVLEK